MLEAKNEGWEFQSKQAVILEAHLRFLKPNFLPKSEDSKHELEIQ